MYTDILIPLDGSSLAEQALCCFEHLAAPNARVVLLQVIRSPIPVITPEMSLPIPDSGQAELLSEAHAYVKGQAANLVKQNVEAEGVVIEGDDVAGTIVDYAHDHGMDLIMMSTHGRGGFSRLVFGSVAEDVIRRTLCPVLVVRPT
ncbi:MAG: universal stress protein [Caldilineales bacterium]|nr:universal stress protein [Caldilineales bacterium]